jgi:hypothetical protein
MGGTSSRPYPWVESVLAAVVVLGIAYCAIHIWLFGYLPPPFFIDPSDTFSDWFNPAFWSHREGTYDTWATIYPPLTFVFLRFLSIDHCYPSSRAFDASAGLAARDCDWLGLVLLGLIFILNIVLTWRTFRKIDPRTAPMRTICVALGMPMLFGLERGNTILVAYTCTLLAFGPLVASARLRWVFVGLAVNFKIYLISGAVALLVKRRWLWVEGAVIATLIVYLLSLAAFGEGTPIEIFRNIQSFSANDVALDALARSSFTYEPLNSVVRTGSFPLSSILGSVWVERLDTALPALKLITQLLIVFAVLAIWYRPNAFAPYRAVTLGILMALESSEAGLYSMVFVSLFVLMEPWRGAGRIWAIVACYLLSFPFDFPIDYLPEGVADLYFTDSTTMISRQITLGPFIRPLLIMSISWAISLATLVELRRALQSGQGDKLAPDAFESGRTIS